MASSEVAMNFSRATQAASLYERYNSRGSSKVRNSQTSVAAPGTPDIYPWPAFHSAASTAERDWNSGSMALPVIDLAGLKSGDPEARARIVRETGAATKAWGFFQIVNHSISDDLQQRMEEQFQQFFTLPLDVKKRAEVIGPNPRMFGYRGLARPGKGWSTEEHIVIKESLADTRAASASFEDLTKKIWPEGNLTFSNTLEEHCLALEAQGRELLEILAESAGVQKDFYSRHFRNPAERCGTWRLHHFPPNPLPSMFFRTEPHTDPSVLTLLKQDVAGLQVKKPGRSEWIDVKPLPGSFVVNVGDILEAWSNGRFPSVEHRVSLNEYTERASMVLFLDAKPSLHVEAPPELIDDEHPSQFVPFSGKEFRTNFEKTKKLGDITRGKALDFFRRRRQ